MPSGTQAQGSTRAAGKAPAVHGVDIAWVAGLGSTLLSRRSASSVYLRAGGRAPSSRGLTSKRGGDGQFVSLRKRKECPPRNAERLLQMQACVESESILPTMQFKARCPLEYLLLRGMLPKCWT